ncbi:Mitogen-activated protein kinase kinase 5 [Phytophthora boehmeriae]|uniref:Mitogen-activated protein kinase kinase 5 n=1 Tax=Phytophthora boehmeriae TaxID=109152 RepID=A0A8T1VBA7_9STRA|nr:Mitogen-activated protein kinase kinase 5 [Phytophthora boehmeriae]
MKTELKSSSLAGSPRRELLAAVRTLDGSMLASLPASSIHLVAATQAGMEQLLRQAHDHVDIVMARHEESESAGSDGEDCVMLATPTHSAVVTTTVSQIVSTALHTLSRSAHGDVGGTGAYVMFAASEVGEARYRRLKAGFTRLKEHVKDVAEHRELLHRAFDQLHANTTALQKNCTAATNQSAVSVDDLMTGLTKSCAAIEEMKVVLDDEVAKQTSSKLAEFERFEEKLETREKLRHQIDIAENHQCEPASLLVVHVVVEAERNALPRNLQRLCRRLAVMTEALEHVFQFHFQLDQCIAEPELETVRRQLSRFFQQSADAFDRIQLKQ